MGLGWWSYTWWIRELKSFSGITSVDTKVLDKKTRNESEGITAKTIGWLGLSHGGDPAKPEIWDTINGIKVPPLPDKTENDKTIGGIDINNNGVRDDVERLIAEKFGDDKELFPKLIEFSKLERSAMISGKADDSVAHFNFSSCLQKMDFTKPFHEQEEDSKKAREIVEKLSALTYAQANTRDRGKAYAKAMMVIDDRMKSCNVGE